MAIIYSYPLATPKSKDLLIGTNVFDENIETSPRNNPTVSFTVQSLINLVATSTGAQNLQQVTNIGATTTNVTTFSTDIKVTGRYYDSADVPGTAGQLLSSTLTGTSWIAAPVTGVTSIAAYNTVLVADRRYVGLVPTATTTGAVQIGLDITGMTDIGAFVTGPDIMVVTDDVAGFPYNKKITVANLKTFINDGTVTSLTTTGTSGVSTLVAGVLNIPNYTYALPLAADGTRGGVQIGYVQNAKNYPIELSSEKMFVNVPWTDTLGVTTFTNVNGTYVSASTVNTTATGAVTVGTLDLSAVDGTSDVTTKFLSKDNTWDVPSYSDPGVTTFTNVNGTYVSAGTVNTAATGGVTVGTIDLSAVDGTSVALTRFLSKDNTWDVPFYSDPGVESFTNVNGTFISAGTVNTSATGAVTIGTLDLSATGTPSSTTYLRGDNSWGAIPTGLIFKDVWDARDAAERGSGSDGGDPDLRLLTPADGWLYIVNIAGSATPNGAATTPNSWNLGDWCIYNGTTWTRVPATNSGVTTFTSTAGTYINITANVAATGAVGLGTVDLNATGTPGVTTYLRGDNAWVVPPNTEYLAMTSTVLGLGKLFDDTEQTVAATAVSTTVSRTYGTQMNSSDQLVVNIPWTDTQENTEWYARDSSDVDKTIDNLTYLKFVTATGSLATDLTGAGTTGDPFLMTLTSPNTQNPFQTIAGAGSNNTDSGVLLSNSGGTVLVLGAGGVAASQTGNTITLTGTTYDISGVGSDNTDSGIRLTGTGTSAANTDVLILGSGATTVSQTGNTITINSTPGSYSWDIKDGSITETITNTDSLQFAVATGTLNAALTEPTTGNFLMTLTSPNTQNPFQTISGTGSNNTDSGILLSNGGNTVLVLGAGSVTASQTGDTITLTGTDSNETYDLNAGAKAGTSVPINLTSTSGSDDSLVNLTEGTNITLTRNSATEITIDATDTNDDTTYTFSIQDPGGTNSNLVITPSTGVAQTIAFTGGTNMDIVPATNQMTFNSTDTLASVTGRGATTATASTFSGGLTSSGAFTGSGLVTSSGTGANAYTYFTGNAQGVQPTNVVGMALSYNNDPAPIGGNRENELFFNPGSVTETTNNGCSFKIINEYLDSDDSDNRVTTDLFKLYGDGHLELIGPTSTTTIETAYWRMPKVTGGGGQILVRNGTSIQLDWATPTTGTVTSVAALTLGTTGTDLSSTVAGGSGAAVITLQVPTASASNRGALSSTDWTTFNNKTSNTGTVESVAVTAGTGITASVADSTTTPNITITNSAPDTGVPAILSDGAIPTLNTGITAAEVRTLIGAGTGDGDVTASSTTTFTNKSGSNSQWTNDENYSTTTGTVTPSSTDTFTNKSGSNSQWTNDEGYITSYSETDTLATVTGRGATTATACSFTNTTYFLVGGSGTGSIYIGNNATSNYARFHTNNVDTYFDMDCGDVLWRQASSTRFEHDMTLGTFTASGDLIAYGSPSDKRLKENIKPIESALDKVEKLQGVTFDWKKSDSILDIKEDIGFIAQDVQKVVPELVRENEDGMLSMRHQGIAPILLEAIKELKQEIEELKQKPCNCNNCNCKK